MSETRQMATLAAITLAIGVVALALSLALPGALEGNLVVDRYTATISADGNLTEHYDYVVKSPGVYRFLFRTWEVPLAGSALSEPSVEVTGMRVPQGTIGYYRDYQGQVTTSGVPTGDALSVIRSLVQDNEIGFYNPSYFTAGTYSADFTYRLHPPIEYDTLDSHLNLRLADQHIPYHSLQVTIPSAGVVSVYPYPPFLTVAGSGGTTTISGSAAANEVVGVEIVASRDYTAGWSGFPDAVADVAGSARSASFWYSLPYYLGGLLLAIGGILVLIMPALLYVVYSRYGREKAFVVPEYLSFVPDRTLPP